MNTNKISTYRETSLHNELKHLYADPGDQVEVSMDGFIVDIFREGLVIEIQTGNFSAIKKKIQILLENYAVKLIYPIPASKWIVRVGPENQRIGRRKSPKKGRLEHLFLELVRIPHLALNPNFMLEVLMIHEEEIRINDGKGSWRRKGWSIQDRRLLGIFDEISFYSPQDYSQLIPEGLPSEFTSNELASELDIPVYLSRKMLYCLRIMEVVVVRGKRGRAYLYTVG
jgi:hypothetical protein